MPFLKVYSTYVNKHPSAIELLIKLQRSSSRFRKFLDECMNKTGMDVESFLILPIQRLPRYELILNVRHNVERRCIHSFLPLTHTTHTHHTHTTIGPGATNDDVFGSGRTRQAEETAGVHQVRLLPRCSFFFPSLRGAWLANERVGVYRKKGDQHGGGGEQEEGRERREDVPNLR
jgi:hypothetical protein